MILAMWAPASVFAVQYQVTNLGPELVSAAPFSYPDAAFPPDGLRLGPTGEVAAIASNGDLLIHRDGVLQRIKPPVSTLEQVKDINASGDILIAGGVSPGSFYTLYSNGTFTPFGGQVGTVSRFNDLRVAGGETCPCGAGQFIPVRVSPDGIAQIDGLPLGTYPLVINNAGLIAGQGPGVGNRYPIVLFDGETLYQPSGVDGYESYVHGLNESGIGVGWVGDDFRRQIPVVFDRNEVRMLTVPSSSTYPRGIPYEINEAGDIVGVDLQWLGGRRALLWRNETPFDLNTLVELPPDNHLRIAMDINDAGQIVAFGVQGDGLRVPRVRVAFLLTPIPEPSTAVTVGLGLVPLAEWVRRRRSRLRA